jgi:hypothetical protein
MDSFMHGPLITKMNFHERQNEEVKQNRLLPQASKCGFSSKLRVRQSDSRNIRRSRLLLWSAKALSTFIST